MRHGNISERRLERAVRIPATAPALALFVVTLTLAAASACSNTNNNATPSQGSGGMPGAGGAGANPGTGGDVPDAGEVDDAGGRDAAPDPNAPYLWFAGAELQAFSRTQVSGSTDAGPAITVAPSAMTATFHDLVFDGDGALWTLPIAGDRILKISAIDLIAGARPIPELAIGSTALKSPQSLAFDPAGNLWVVSFNGTSASVASIVRFDGVRDLDANGDVTLTPSLTIGPGTDATLKSRFTQGTAIGFDANGSLWFGSSAGVMRFDHPGALQGTVIAAPDAFVSVGESCLSFAFDGQGALWVSAALSSFHVVKLTDPGTFTGNVTGAPAARLTLPAQGASFAGGLAFDTDGALWISMSNRMIKIANPGTLAGNVTPTPDVTLGLSPAIFPDLTTKLGIWPKPSGLPLY